MIIRNETMFMGTTPKNVSPTWLNGKTYKQDSNDNTAKLKKLMSELVIQESKADKQGGDLQTSNTVWKGNFGSKKRKAKTFKL